MEELLKSLGIDKTAGAEVIVEKLELKQSEIMERLDNVEDEKRKQKLEDDLTQIETAIEAFSWMRGKKQTGIARKERKEEACEKYNQEYEEFKKQIEERPEIRQYESKIASQQARISSLKGKGAGSPITILWIFLMAGLLFCFFMSVLVKCNKHLLEASVEVSAQFVIGIIAYFVNEGSFHGHDLSELEYAFSEFDYYRTNEFGKLFVIAVWIPFVIPFAVTFVCWVRHHMEEDYDGFVLACFKSLWKTVLISPIISFILLWIGYLCLIFEKQVQIIGTVALIIAVPIIVKCIMNIMGKIMYDRREKEIVRLNLRIDADYKNIEGIIGMEYQKIYDRYPDVGSNREAVSKVQSRLMDNIKKRNGI